MYKTKNRTFIDICLNGKASIDDVDEYIADWHRSGGRADIVSHLRITDD
jgi:hypothetical protein